MNLTKQQIEMIDKAIEQYVSYKQYHIDNRAITVYNNNGAPLINIITMNYETYKMHPEEDANNKFYGFTIYHYMDEATDTRKVDIETELEHLQMLNGISIYITDYIKELQNDRSE